MNKTIKEIKKELIINDFKEKNKELKIIEKLISIDFYSKKKLNLCYEKLIKPKIKYYIVFIENNKEFIKDINKTLFDYLVNVPFNSLKLLNQLKSVYTDNYNFYKDYLNKDYEHLNYLNNKEKLKINIIKELFINNDVFNSIELIKEL